MDEAIAEFVRNQVAYAERERKALADRLPLEREAAEVERKLARAKEMFLNGLIEMDELEPTVKGLKARKADIETKLAAAETPKTVTATRPRPSCSASG